jgi:malate dehydrogenase (quinone)
MFQVMTYTKDREELDSTNGSDIGTLLAAGAKNVPLVHYKMEQVLASKEDWMVKLRTFVPEARMKIGN